MEVTAALDKSCFGKIVRVKKPDWNGLRENERKRIESGMYGQLFAEIFTKRNRNMVEAAEVRLRDYFFFNDFSFYLLESKNLVWESREEDSCRSGQEGKESSGG